MDEILCDSAPLLKLWFATSDTSFSFSKISYKDLPRPSIQLQVTVESGYAISCSLAIIHRPLSLSEI